MEKVKEIAKKYEISVILKNSGYFSAKVSFKLGGVPSKRLEKSGTSDEAALLNLLNEIINYIDSSFNAGIITEKFDDIVAQRLVGSINKIGITSSEITEKTLIIVHKINTINNSILNNISIHSNVLPFYNQTSESFTENSITNMESITNTQNFSTQNKCILKDFFKDWLKYRLSLCEKTVDNPKPLSRKTIDSNHKILYNEIIPYLEKNKILYLSQLSETCIRNLLKNIKCQNSKHKAYIVLNMTLKHAIKKQLLSINPLVDIEKPPEKIKTGEGNTNENYIDSDRLDIWLDKFEEEDKTMCTLFAVMLLTGIRPEEACGLQWNALDFQKGVLKINNAYKNVNDYDDEMNIIGHIKLDDRLKTDESYREIPLNINPRLTKILQKHMEKQQYIFKHSRAIKSQHRKWSLNEYIFLGRTFHPYVVDSLAGGLSDFRDNHNLERVTPYGLRHSFATYWSEKGMDDVVLQTLMRTR